jgi:hypothetical protein
VSIDAHNFQDRDDGDEELSFSMDRTVQRIRAASRIVHPSELLRTKILERARQQERDSRSDRTVLRAVMAVALCSILLIFAASKVDAWRQDHVHRSSWEGMQERAAEIAAEQRIAMDASLFEAYAEWRFDLARRWRNSNANESAQP